MFSSFLLGAALLFGQASEPIAIEPEPEAAAPTPAAAPDRWLLLKSLQGTWPGWVLDDHRVQILGWTDASFTASSATHDQLPMGFNYRANELLLQQNWLRIESPVVSSGTTQPTFGFRSDWILPGSDYRFTLARGLFDDQLTANDGSPSTYGFDPVELYAEVYFPNVAHGLDIKLGRVFCQYGVETIDAPSNALFSHGYTFIYDPFTHTGLMATAKLTDTWTVQLGIMLGSDVFIDPASEPYGMATFRWAPPGGRDTVLLSFIFGSGRFNQIEAFNNPNIVDLVYTHQLTSRLTYSFEGLGGYQTNVPAIGTAHWFGLLNYLTLVLTPRLSGTMRLEFFDDIDGQRTGFAGLYTAATAGVAFKPRKELTIRPELRYDYNADSRPFENQHGLFTAAVDLIVRW